MKSQLASSVTLREDAKPTDRNAIQRIVQSTGFFSPAEIEVAVELVDQRLAKGEASGYFFLFAESDGRVHGYASYGPIACTVGSYDLFWIAVDRQEQHQGLGRLLLKAVEERIRDHKGRHIYIETSNRSQYAPTRDFYQRCGYEIATILPDFYDDGDDKVVLRKTIGKPG